VTGNNPKWKRLGYKTHDEYKAACAATRATWLERSRGGIYNHIKAMEADGTLKANPQGGENNG